MIALLCDLDLYLNGFACPPNGGNVPEFQIFIHNPDNSPVGEGSYNVDGLLLPTGYRIEVDYAVNADMSVTKRNTSSTFFPPIHLLLSI